MRLRLAEQLGDNGYCTFQVFHFNHQLYKLNPIPTHGPVIDTPFVLIPCYLITFALPLYCIAYAKSKTWKLQKK